MLFVFFYQSVIEIINTITDEAKPRVKNEELLIQLPCQTWNANRQGFPQGPQGSQQL